jgi:hypothetical protein
VENSFYFNAAQFFDSEQSGGHVSDQLAITRFPTRRAPPEAPSPFRQSPGTSLQ